MNLFNLVATLVLKTDDYEKGLKNSEKSASNFASKAKTAFKGVATAVTAVVSAVIAVSTAIAKLTTEAIALGDEIDKNSQKLGLTAEGYQVWALAAEMAGAEVSTLQTGIRQLNTQIDNLASGNADAVVAFNKLGLSISDVQKMSFDDTLMAVVNGLQSMTDQTEKAQVANTLFGSRAYQELLPLLNQEAGSVEELAKQFKKMGIILSDDVVTASAELNDEITLMKSSMKSAAATMASELYPAISQIVQGLTALITGAEDAEEALNNLVAGISDIINKSTEILPDLVKALGNGLIEVLRGTLSEIPKMIPELMEVIEELLFAIIDFLPDLVGSAGEIITALIKGLLQLDWASLIIELLNTLTEILLVQLPDIVFGLIDMLFDLFTSPEGLVQLGKIGIKLAESLVNGLIMGIESGLNLIVKALNLILKGISKLWEWMGIPAIPEIPEVSLPRVSFMKDGGMFEDLMNGMGTTYAVAGENGAEIVAQGSKGTGVTNVEQFSEAMLKALKAYFGNGAVTIRIGDKDFKGYLLQTVNSGLKQQGRQTLNQVTRW